MKRFVARHIAPEMLLLLLLEMAMAFGLACALLAPGVVVAGRVGAGLRLSMINHAAVIAGTVGFVGFVVGLYRPQVFMRTRRLLLTTAMGGALAFPAVWAVSAALGIRWDWLVGPDRLWPTKILAAWLVGLFVSRLCFLAAVRGRLFLRRVVVLGPPGDVGRTVAAIRAGRAGFFEVASGGPSGRSPQQLRGEGIRFALTSARQASAMSWAERDAYALAGIELLDEPTFFDRQLKRIAIDHLTPVWFDALDSRPDSRVRHMVNRVGDVLTSVALLLFTLPLMLLVALAIRLESRGPVLYRQERVGLGGESFVLLKFRSMRCDAEARGPAWAQRRDPRVTRIGAAMRRLRIDELPQLLNVLRGEMSFIGPRPERPHFVEQLAGAIPFYRERARVKPGLTGWAQVNYPYGASVEDARAKLSYDLYYVKNRSLLLDLVILLSTVRVILFQEGAR